TWWLNVLPNFFEPVFYLVSIGIGVGAYVTRMEGMSYVAFLAPGLVCVAAMNGASFEVTYNIYVRLTFEKAYDAMLTTPVEPDVVFPLKERLSPNWLWVAEALPLLHPVRLARAAFRGTADPVLLWDLAYTLGVSALLLAWARGGIRRRLTS